MKKLILSVTIAVTIITLSLSAFCDDEVDVDAPVGQTLSATIVADSLEDFSEKLKNLAEDEMEVFYFQDKIPGTYERVLERIDSGKDVVYVPNIGLEKMGFNMFIESYNPDYKIGVSQKYGIVHEGDEIGLNTNCQFTYNNSKCWIGYNDGAFIADRIITLYDKTIRYSAYPTYSILYFDFGGEKLGLYIGKTVTEEDIKALPRGMFYPNTISITDIKNGDFSAVSGSIDIDVDDPKESYDIECIVE